MTRRKPTAHYRPMLAEAWRLTWERKSLLVFGIFAALISTGGVVDVVVTSFQKVQQCGAFLTRLMDSSFIGYDVASQYLVELQLMGQSRAMGIITFATLVGVLLVVMATLSQGALILGLKKKKTAGPYTLKKESAAHFWSLFILAILNKLMTGILILLMTLPLFLLYLQSTSQGATLFFTLILIFITLLIIVNIVYMFALMDIVDGNRHPLDAIATGWKLFARQWLATLEFGILLFLLVALAGLVLIGLLFLLTIPYAFIFTTTLLTGSSMFFLVANTLFGLLLIAFILAFGGAAVTFQYSAWHQFYLRGLHRTHGKKVFSKILRLAYR
ncbi:hypothetical protein HZA87_00310 [Candidatus Uhrbacteria bacterium]|nr:hypothetical protein [Candidatus Uhrbacteria bacterium]